VKTETPDAEQRTLRLSPAAALAFGAPAVVVLALLPLLQLRPESVPRLALFLGRFHPTLLHLPIAFLSLALLLDAIRHGRPRGFEVALPDGVLDGVLWLCALSAFASAGTGWLLAHEGGYDPDLLGRHLWAGVATGIGAIACAVLRAFALARPERPRLRQAASGVLALTVLAMVVAAHAGGSLTHGEGFLTEYAPAPVRRLIGLPVLRDRSREPLRTIAEREVFDGVVLRTLEDHCLECHNAARLKGELRLDSYAALLAGGQSGAVVAPGDAEASELLRRVRLPLEDDDHMPPRGKPQPSAAAVAVLAWWVERDAPETGTVASLGAPLEIRDAIERSLPERERAAVVELTRRRAAEYEAVLSGLREKIPGSLRPLVPGERELEYTAAIAGERFGDAELAALGAVADQLVWLDLSRTGITDAGLAAVARMRELRHLDLRGTAIGDAGVEALGGLAALETLSLYGTGLSDAGLDSLQRGLPALRHLYVGDTAVTEQGLARLREARPQLEVTP